jgi:hypothetical protein
MNTSEKDDQDNQEYHEDRDDNNHVVEYVRLLMKLSNFNKNINVLDEIIMDDAKKGHIFSHESAFYYACLTSNVEILKYLLENTTFKLDMMIEAIEHLCRYDSVHMFSLLSNKLTYDCKEKCLSISCKESSYCVVTYLLDVDKIIPKKEHFRIVHKNSDIRLITTFLKNSRLNNTYDILLLTLMTYNDSNSSLSIFPPEILIYVTQIMLNHKIYELLDRPKKHN